MSSVSRSPADLDDALRRQVRLLLASAATYDAAGPNADDEALNMATRLRVLLHTGRDPASLARVGLLPGMKMCDSVGPPPEESAAFLAAINQVINLAPAGHERHVSFRPALNTHSKLLNPGQQVARLASWPDFASWWETAVFVRDHGGQTFTRKGLVQNVANKDGGAHIDATLPSGYASLTRGPGTIGLSIRLDTGADYDGRDPTPALIRQITYEVERSLKRAAPDLMP